MAKKKSAKRAAEPTLARPAGARKVADVPREAIDAMHRGERETRSLVEALAVDPFAVGTFFLESAGRSDLAPTLTERRGERAVWTFPKATAAIGETFAALRERGTVDDSFAELLAQHPSDVVRSFACYAIAARRSLSLRAKLKALKPLAADGHFGVREFAWLAVRNDLARELDAAIAALTKWTDSDDANVRRFASEATRPRGVWCAHIAELKSTPELAMSILEPLRADASPYVRASVGNWLNDASKSRPDFVRALCERWLRESDCAETEAICRRGRRSLQ